MGQQVCQIDIISIFSTNNYPGAPLSVILTHYRRLISGNRYLSVEIVFEISKNFTAVTCTASLPKVL